LFSGDRLDKGVSAQKLLADRGHDSDSILVQTLRQGMEPVIPPRKHKKIQRSYDKTLYKARHLVENAFLYLKNGEALQLATPKKQHHFLQLFTSGASFCGRQSRDYTA